MANLAYELGFDWNAQPIIQARDGLYPLQICMVNDDEREATSPCSSSTIGVDDNLTFRVYDFTNYEGSPPGHPPIPNCIQVLFTSAKGESTTFSPFNNGGVQLAQLASKNFTQQNPVESIAFGEAAALGWTFDWYPICVCWRIPRSTIAAAST